MSKDQPGSPTSDNGMDQISAHLDHGWDLLGRGDYRGARVSAKRVIELDSDSPEGYTLLGAIGLGEGDPEDAMEQFSRAMELDPEYLEPMLYAAETLIHVFGDCESAL